MEDSSACSGLNVLLWNEPQRRGGRRGEREETPDLGNHSSAISPRPLRLGGSFILDPDTAGFDRTPRMAIFPSPTLTLP
jgi:hypothetical protein